MLPAPKRPRLAGPSSDDELDDSWADCAPAPPGAPPVDPGDDSWADELPPRPACDCAVPASWADPLGHASKLAREPLKRLEGAHRDGRPAWMTKGIGIGAKILGEPTGELIKPGLTRADLERAQAQGPTPGPDVFGEVFRERKISPAPLAAVLPDEAPSTSRSAPEAPTPPAAPAAADAAAAEGPRGSAPEAAPGAAPARAAAAAAEPARPSAARGEEACAGEDVPAGGSAPEAAPGAAPVGAADATAEPARPSAARGEEAGADEDAPADRRTVVIKNISYEVQEDQFELDMEECGDIRDLRFGGGSAVVEYWDAAGALGALKLDGDEYWGRPLRVELKRDLDARSGAEAFVSGFRPGTSEEVVRNFFSACGEILSARLPKDQDNRSKGVAFITFLSEAALSSALGLNGRLLDGRELTVGKARRMDQPKGSKGSKGSRSKSGGAKGGGKDKGKRDGKGSGKGKGKKAKGDR